MGNHSGAAVFFCCLVIGEMQMKIGILIIVILVLMLAIIGLGIYAYIVIRDKIRRVKNTISCMTEVIEEVKEIEKDAELSPKSVSSATDLYLPQIMRDFPDFHYGEMKTRAENVLTSYLRALDSADVNILSEGTEELRNALQLKLRSYKERRQEVNYCDVHIHKTEIHKYFKSHGKCMIVFQSAVEYFYDVEQNGRVVRGKKDARTQARYNVKVMYIQDRELIENQNESGLAMNCPNCGAPLTTLGAKKCKYCDTPIVEFNIRTWNFTSVQEC